MHVVEEVWENDGLFPRPNSDSEDNVHGKIGPCCDLPQVAPDGC